MLSFSIYCQFSKVVALVCILGGKSSIVNLLYTGSASADSTKGRTIFRKEKKNSRKFYKAKLEIFHVPATIYKIFIL